MSQPSAVISYAHLDDQHDNGFISKSADRLSLSVQQRMGMKFPVFLDKSLQGGEDWVRSIRNSIDGASIYIPMLSPSFLRSQYCLDEAEHALARAKRHSRPEILPITYVELPPMEELEERAGGVLGRLQAHQFPADWTTLRFHPTDSQMVREEFSRVAGSIQNALKRLQQREAQRKTNFRKAIAIVLVLGCLTMIPILSRSQPTDATSPIDKPSANSPPSPNTDSNLPGKDRRLSHFIPREYRGTCQHTNKVPDTDPIPNAALRCVVPENGLVVSYYRYKTLADMKRPFVIEVDRAAGLSARGMDVDCRKRIPSLQSRSRDGNRTGRLLCFREPKGELVAEWTEERLALLVVAILDRDSEANVSTFLDWVARAGPLVRARN